MHSSTGLAISADEMLRMAPPEVIRWLIMQPQPNRHVDFDPGLGLLNSVDKYDRIEKDYYGKNLEENSARAFELSQIGKQTENKEQIIPYRHLVTLTQSKDTIDEIERTLIGTGEISELNKSERAKLELRIKCIEGWIKKHAPESVKFEVQKSAPSIDFGDDDLKRIGQLREQIGNIEWTPEKIHDSFYTLQEKNDTPAKEYFRIMYLTILGKERGPRLGFFLATMEQKFVVERLNSY